MSPLLALDYFKQPQPVAIALAEELQQMALVGMGCFSSPNPQDLDSVELNDVIFDWVSLMVMAYGVSRTYRMLLESALYYGYIANQ